MEFKKGDRVVIIPNYDYKKCLMGTVLESKESEVDHSYHGSPYYPVITRVLGDNGRIYSNDSNYSVCFNYPNDACDIIQKKIDECNEEAKVLREMQLFILRKKSKE